MDFQLGFWFGKKYWGLGYASEAVSAVLSLLKCHNVKGYIYTAVHPENIASIKILEKFGFIKQNITNVNSGVKPPMVDYRLAFF